MSFRDSLRVQLNMVVEIISASYRASEVMRVDRQSIVSRKTDAGDLLNLIDLIVEDIKILLHRIEFIREKLGNILLEYRDSSLYHLGITLKDVSAAKNNLRSFINTLHGQINQMSTYIEIVTSDPVNINKHHQKIKLIYSRSYRTTSSALNKSKEKLIILYNLI